MDQIVNAATMNKLMCELKLNLRFFLNLGSFAILIICNKSNCTSDNV